jgi:K+/H+ antiporter YhaU regulatory subunit KhtT
MPPAHHPCDGDLIVGPSAATVLGQGDVMMAIGTRDQLGNLKTVAS